MNSLTSFEKLFSLLKLSSAHQKKIDTSTNFPLLIPLRLIKKIKPNTLTDPLFLQFVPLLKEQKKDPHFSLDPIQEQKCQKGSLLQKYPGRSLLICSNSCGMHCRFCFRRHFTFPKSTSFFDELKEISKDPSQKEILLSGGDPLSLSNTSLKELLQRIEEIPHITKIRFHTRFPIGFPERIDKELLSIFSQCQKQIVFVLHTNHASEWDDILFDACKKLQKIGIPILTQTVLLKGVNDNVAALTNLFNLLTDHGMLPYYLHQLDQVMGAKHFETPEKKGLLIMQKLKETLPGYAVPKYVKEIAEKKYKYHIKYANNKITYE